MSWIGKKKRLQRAWREEATRISNAKKRLRRAWNELTIDGPKASWHQARGDRALRRIGRVALVKQDLYNDLYCCPTGLSAQETVFSSMKRTGPAGLFTAGEAELVIVRTEDDPECQIWQQAHFDCGHHPLEYFETVKHKPYLDGKMGHTVPQSVFAVSADSVDWSRYDLVIGLNAPVPTRIVRRHPRTTWAYYVSEPCMRAYDQSAQAPLAGYDLFLNQRFRLPAPPGALPHEAEVPYYLQYVGCLEELLGGPIPDARRRGVAVELHTGVNLTPDQRGALERFGPVRLSPGGPVQGLVRNLAESRYFIHATGRALWGNALIEAIAAGCLVLANPQLLANGGVLTPETEVSDVEGVLERLRHFEANPADFERARDLQRRRINYLCWSRPLRRLLDVVERKRRG